MSIESDGDGKRDIKVCGLVRISCVQNANKSQRTRHEPPAYEPTTVDRPITYSPPPFQGMEAFPFNKPTAVKVQPIQPVKIQPIEPVKAPKPATAKRPDTITEEKASESDEEGEIAE